MVRSLLFAAVVLCVGPVFAEAPAAPETKLCKPGKLVAFEKFDKPGAMVAKGKVEAGQWRDGLGDWKTVDGAAYAIQEAPSEKRPNGHEAVCEYVTDMGDFVLTAEFKMNESPQVAFVFRDTNQPNLHQGRVMIKPDAFWIQKMSGISKETRREELKRVKHDVATDKWHKLTIEVVGDRMRATLDGQEIEASHERFLEHKGRIGFVARGEGALFRNVGIWEAARK
ncbi:family 16 glycoside hydrolase [Bremerella sp.]|uniref:family 16 glycoside hydrolase n=1 Tax=Bremerella sp. TaxID=2795602 RepID=UPI00391E0021